MDAGGAVKVPTDLIQWFGGVGGTAALVFFLWGFLIKDPPLFVTWREHKKLMDEEGKADAKIERYLDLIITVNQQTNKQTNVMEAALEVAKGESLAEQSRTGGRVGHTKGRHQDANETD